MSTLSKLEIVEYRCWISDAYTASTEFDCGHKELNEYLVNHTNIEANGDKDNILLATLNDKIVGFVSYRIRDIFPGRQTVMSNEDGYPYMVVEALAVHKDYRGKKIGMLLLTKVIEATFKVHNWVTLHGIYLSAYYEAVNFYKNKFSFEVINKYLLNDQRKPIPMRLSIDSVIRLYFVLIK